MSRIGVFGGSFNPIHLGHVALARQLRQLAALDEVWLMVSPQNPLKPQSALLDDARRLQMAQVALEHEEGVRASDYEMHLPRPSYTWDTMCHLRHDYPAHSFTLLIGADNWALFPRWYRHEDLVREFPIVIYPRRDSPIDAAELPPTVTLVPTELVDVSSTDIRRRIRQGLPIEGLVPPAVVPLALQYYGDTTSPQPLT